MPGSRGTPRSPAGSRAPRAGVPSAIFSPWSSTVTRSEMPMTTLMSCSISRMVSPRSSRRRPHEPRQRAGLLRVHPGGRLVEQQQLGLGRQRARDLQPALIAVGAGCAPTPRPCRSGRRSEQLARPLARPRVSSRRTAACAARRRARSTSAARACRPARSRARSSSGTAGCSGRCARCPAAVIEVRPARPVMSRRRSGSAPGRRVQPGEHVEERGLAGAVRADQSDDRASGSRSRRR